MINSFVLCKHVFQFLTSMLKATYKFERIICINKSYLDNCFVYYGTKVYGILVTLYFAFTHLV
jgi:hypothetical protein